MIDILKIVVLSLTGVLALLMIANIILDKVIAKQKKEIARQEELSRTIMLCKYIISINNGEVECQIDDPIVYEFFEKHMAQLSDNEIVHSYRWAVKNEHYKIASLLHNHI